MNNVLKKKWFGIAFCVFAFFLFGCTEKKRSSSSWDDGDLLQLSVKESNPEENSEMPFMHREPNDGLICVMFGYGFNTEDFYTNTISRLKEKYGLEEDGGLIVPIIYPDDLKSRISNLYDVVSERNIKGLILLGAPEMTHKTLMKLRNDWNGHPPYAIFSFMPQDDILGQESCCDFVLEYERKTNIEVESENVVIGEDADDIVLRAVRYMAALPSALPLDLDLHSHVQSIVGEKKVRRYTDTESGIQVINHFIIE